jgi:putative transposase
MKQWNQLSRGLNWEDELAVPIAPKELATLRRATHTGRPFASDSMLSKIERALGRRLRPLPPGRPRKAGGRLKK